MMLGRNIVLGLLILNIRDGSMWLAFNVGIDYLSIVERIIIIPTTRIETIVANVPVKSTSQECSWRD